MKKWSKRCLAFTVVICIALMAAIPSLAAVPPESSPYYIALRSIYSDLVISNNNVAECTGTATAATGYTINATLELQQQNSRGWTSIKTWSDQGKNIAIEEDWPVSSSSTYRLKLTANVYNAAGTLIESPYAYSGEIST